MDDIKKAPYKHLNREEILEKLYQNEDVIISLKKGLVYTYDPESESVQRSRLIQGFVLAVDKNYIHLGPSPDELYCSIDLTDISVIFKNKEIDPEILEQMRKDGEGVH